MTVAEPMGNEDPRRAGSPRERRAERQRNRRPLRFARVDWIQGAGKFVWLHSGGRRRPLKRTLTALAHVLHPERFVQVHRSTIVNVECVAEVRPTLAGGVLVVLHDGTQLPVSRNYLRLMRALERRA